MNSENFSGVALGVCLFVEHLPARWGSLSCRAICIKSIGVEDGLDQEEVCVSVFGLWSGVRVAGKREVSS